MFEIFVVKPLFNLLVLIYALVPGHNFGLAIIIFTIVIRFFFFFLLKKQLHHARAIRELQPELKKIKQASKGDRQKESMLVMELYKERQVSPFGSLGIIAIQFVILIGLYSGLRRVVDNPEAIVDLTYGWIAHLPWIQTLSGNLELFDATLFGVVDLTRAAISEQGFYLPAMILVIGSAIAQYLQSSQLLPRDKDAKSLRSILKEAGNGKQADQAEINAAIGRSTRYIIPGMILLFTVGIASALNLYWFVGGAVAYLQQKKILDQDEDELEKVADKSQTKEIIEGEIVQKKSSTKKPNKKPTPKKTTKKRRKR
ncbi:membrane protein insertase YidC [Candidatus Saccharibacteria bacterium]|nr:membrane protein insertase YidC [Candidatus Saccharibacteria bacterium]